MTYAELKTGDSFIVKTHVAAADGGEIRVFQKQKKGNCSALMLNEPTLLQGVLG